jgi:hypothetical protein
VLRKTVSRPLERKPGAFIENLLAEMHVEILETVFCTWTTSAVIGCFGGRYVGLAVHGEACLEGVSEISCVRRFIVTRPAW